MKYITAEQFLKADKKVQEAILDWWKNNIEETDLVGYIGKVIAYKEREPWLVKNVDLCCLPIGKETIPLLTEGQLIQFIEDRTNGKVIFDYLDMIGGYSIGLILNKDSPTRNVKWHEDFGSNLLQALWQVACEVVIN